MASFVSLVISGRDHSYDLWYDSYIGRVRNTSDYHDGSDAVYDREARLSLKATCSYPLPWHFGRQARFIWRTNWTWAKPLFFILRYPVIIEGIFSLICEPSIVLEISGSSTEDSMRTEDSMYTGSSAIVSFLFSSIMLLIADYAVLFWELIWSCKEILDTTVKTMTSIYSILAVISKYIWARGELFETPLMRTILMRSYTGLLWYSSYRSKVRRQCRIEIICLS